jgi:hypothetical protein
MVEKLLQGGVNVYSSKSLPMLAAWAGGSFRNASYGSHEMRNEEREPGQTFERQVELTSPITPVII